ncbi:MAG: AAA family ATPase [Enterobacterales bacterium]
MNNTQLNWNELIPEISNRVKDIDLQKFIDFHEILCKTQSNIVYGLNKLLRKKPVVHRYLIICANENDELFKLIAEMVDKFNLFIKPKCDVNMYTKSDKPCIWRLWAEYDELFGSLIHDKNMFNLKTGIIQKSNRYVLILGLKSLIVKPFMWFRLKNMIIQKRFDWLSKYKDTPLSYNIPSKKLDLKLILIGNESEILKLYSIDNYFIKFLINCEFRELYKISNNNDIKIWCSWVHVLAKRNNLPPLSKKAWPIFIKQATRFSENQFQLPLSPSWILFRLKEAICYQLYSQNQITDKSILQSYLKEYHENIYYLYNNSNNYVKEGQCNIQIKGSIIGQINSLSVIDNCNYEFGDVSRITCLVYPGNGYINDIDRKSNLSGNLHTKGNYIVQACLMHMLDLDYPLSFSVSLVSEQSYNQIDGDSGSLTEFLVLISALSKAPIKQQISVTGSLDQFGNVQSIGGVNHKIESFFELCLNSGELSGNQGVIIPKSNLINISLNDNVINAIKEKKFYIWGVSNVSEASEIIIDIPSNNKLKNMINSIKYIYNDVDTLSQDNFNIFKKIKKFFS